MTDHARQPGSQPGAQPGTQADSTLSNVTEHGLPRPRVPGDEAVLDVLSEFQTGLESLKHLCSERKTQMEQLKRAEEDLAARATALATAESVLSRARETLERENASLRASRVLLDEQRAASKLEHETRTRELDDRTKALESRVREFESARADLGRRAEDLAKREASVAALSANLEEATRARDDLFARLTETQRQADAIRAELESSRAEIAKLRGSLEDASSRLNAAGQQSSGATQELLDARSKLAEFEARASELESASAQDRQKLEQAAAVIESLRSGGGESQAELAGARAHIETLSRELTECRAKLQDAQRDLSVLEQTEARSRESAQKLATELHEARSFGGGMTEFSRNRKNRLQRAKLMLREQTEKLRVAGDALRARFEQCEHVLAQRQELASAREVVNAAQRRLEKNKARSRSAATLMYACLTLLFLGAFSWIVSGQVWPGTFAAHSTIGADSRTRTLSQAELAEWQTFHQSLLADPRFHEAAADRFNKRGIVTLGTPPLVAKFLETSTTVEFNEPGEMKIEVRAEGSDRAERLADTLTGALISYANASRQRRVDGSVTVLRQNPAADRVAIDNTRLQMAGVLMGGCSILAMFGGVVVWRKLATAKSSFEQTAMLDAILDEHRWQPPVKAA